MKIEPPDLALAYTRLAPLVTEAHAYMKAGKTDEAAKVLEQARRFVATCTATEFVFEAFDTVPPKTETTREGRKTYHCPACNGKLDPTNLQFCGHCNWQDDSIDIDAAIDRGHAMDAEET